MFAVKDVQGVEGITAYGRFTACPVNELAADISS